MENRELGSADIKNMVAELEKLDKNSLEYAELNVKVLTMLKTKAEELLK